MPNPPENKTTLKAQTAQPIDGGRQDMSAAHASRMNRQPRSGARQPDMRSQQKSQAERPRSHQRTTRKYGALKQSAYLRLLPGAIQPPALGEAGAGFDGSDGGNWSEPSNVIGQSDTGGGADVAWSEVQPRKCFRHRRWAEVTSGVLRGRRQEGFRQASAGPGGDIPRRPGRRSSAGQTLVENAAHSDERAKDALFH